MVKMINKDLARNIERFLENYEIKKILRDKRLYLEKLKNFLEIRQIWSVKERSTNFRV